MMGCQETGNLLWEQQAVSQNLILLRCERGGQEEGDKCCLYGVTYGGSHTGEGVNLVPTLLEGIIYEGVIVVQK